MMPDTSEKQVPPFRAEIDEMIGCSAPSYIAKFGAMSACEIIREPDAIRLQSLLEVRCEVHYTRISIDVFLSNAGEFTACTIDGIPRDQAELQRTWPAFDPALILAKARAKRTMQEQFVASRTAPTAA